MEAFATSHFSGANLVLDLVLLRKNDGSLIGLCGLRKVLWADHPLTPCTEIAWRQARESWEHGYMTKAAIASLGDGFQRAKIYKIFSWTDRHSRSAKALHDVERRCCHWHFLSVDRSVGGGQ
ncbi:GNAT family N-acetyltransferase [Klebsiella pneumoniae]|uniref:GNAT family N-acetyltransferase n=1 Tax=Klebsiella pneumoniae TaxID=573 RepID=UPI0039757868